MQGGKNSKAVVLVLMKTKKINHRIVENKELLKILSSPGKL